MPTVRYVANRTPGDGTTRLGPFGKEGDVFLELGGPAGDLSAEEVKRSSDRFVLETASGADAGVTDDDIKFDPGAHNVDTVTSFLNRASDADRELVKTLESEGKARKGVLEWEPEPEQEEGGGQVVDLSPLGTPGDATIPSEGSDD